MIGVGTRVKIRKTHRFGNMTGTVCAVTRGVSRAGKVGEGAPLIRVMTKLNRILTVHPPQCEVIEHPLYKED